MTLLPKEACGNSPQTDECGALFATGEYILSSGWTYLQPFAPTVDNCPCGSFETYVSLGEPAVDLCDKLIVWLRDYSPLPSRNTNACMWPTMQASWMVELWESCWPTVEEANGRVTFPATDDLHETGRAIYNHGMTLYRGIMSDYYDHTLFPDNGQYPALTFGGLTPITPQGGCAGWRFSVTGDLIWPEASA